MTTMIRRHISEFTLLLVLTLGGLYLTYAIDVFHNESLDTVHDLQIELNEALLYGAGLTVLFMAYAAWLYHSRRRQERRQRRAMVEAQRAGESDPLTGLANRRRFDAALAEMLATSAGPGRDAVMMIDLDRFKAVNDTYGHAAGDAILLAAARRIAGAVREGDIVARIGGDEFAVLAPAVGNAATARLIAARIAAAVREPIAHDGHSHEIGCSIGVRLAPLPDADAADVVAMADIAMYGAKRAHEPVRLHAG